MSAWLALAAPPSAPQLNGQEKYFKSFDDIVDHCCYVWITLIDLSRGKSCPSRAAMATRESGKRRERFSGAGGRSKKLRPSLPRSRRRLNFKNIVPSVKFANDFN
jgi:hypothetical protein